MGNPSRTSLSGSQSGHLIDHRIDKIISWLLPFIAVVALSVGAYFFQRLDSQLSHLTNTVNELKTQVALSAIDREEIATLRERVRELELELSQLKGKK